MATTSNGIYKLTLEQKLFGQVCYNVFYYWELGGENNAPQPLTTAFDGTVLPEIAKVQSDDVSYLAIRSAAMTGTAADYVLAPSQADGDQVGTPLPAFMALGVTYNRQTKEVRNGAKRFAGMLKENTSGSVWTAAYTAIVDLMLPFLELDLSSGGFTYRPIIARPPTPPSGVWTYALISNITLNGDVTSQNSRKRGTGI